MCRTKLLLGKRLEENIDGILRKISLKSDARKVLQDYKKMEGYRIQEKILKQLQKEYPDHKNKAAVDIKVKLLNLFYSTGIQAVNKMTDNVLSINNIDERLTQGDLLLVSEIATLRLVGGERNNYSFATKYCALHQPEKFPIYDSIVADTFESLFEQGFLPQYHYKRSKTSEPNTFTKSEFAAKLKNYKFYVRFYDYFMELFDLKDFTYREIDSYIWGAFKLAGNEFEIEKLAKLNKSKIVQVDINKNY